MLLEMDLQLVRPGFRFEIARQLDVTTLGLFGPSGAGKTTLLHLLAGLERPDRGRIVLDGTVLCDTDRCLFVPPHKRRVGVVFQHGRLFPHLRVRGNLKFAQWLVPRASRRLSLDAIVDILELGSLLDRRISHLSGGERQRVALARTLLAAPRIVLLDEPASALDANREGQILPLLKRIGTEFELPMILVSHRLGQIRYLTDTLLIINDGRVQAGGVFSTLIRDREAMRLMGGHELLNVLRLRVTEQHSAEGMTVFAFSEPAPRELGDGHVPSIKGPLASCTRGTEVVATVRPEDIIVSLAPVEYISARNQLRGRITRVVQAGGRTLCSVDVGTELLADITHLSATELELKPGKKIWCLFKTHAVAYPYGCPNRSASERSTLTMKGNERRETALARTCTV